MVAAGVDPLRGLLGQPYCPLPDLCHDTHAVALCEGNGELTEAAQRKNPYNRAEAAIAPAARLIAPRRSVADPIPLANISSFLAALLLLQDRDGPLLAEPPSLHNGAGNLRTFARIRSTDRSIYPFLQVRILTAVVAFRLAASSAMVSVSQ